MQEAIGREQWSDFAKEFNHRNSRRATRLEVVGQEIGAQEVEAGLKTEGRKQKTESRRQNIEDKTPHVERIFLRM